MTQEHGEAILSRLPDGKIIGAEIGVFRGRLSAYLLKMRPDLRLYMIDCWTVHANDSSYALSDDYVGNLTRADIEEAKYQTEFLTRFAANRREIINAFSLDAVANIPDAHLDFAFIDADHTFDGAHADIVAWYPKIKPGGLICGHDIDFPDKPKWEVRRAVEVFAAELGKNFEVAQNYTWFIRR